MMNHNKSQDDQVTRSGWVRLVLGFDRWMSQFEDAIAIFMFSIMTLTVLTNVLFRYVLQIPMMWGEELSRYSMVIGVYVGVIICVKEKAHLGISGLVDMLPPKLKRIVNMVVDLATMAGYVIIAVLEYNFTISMQVTRQTSPAIHVPLYMLYGAITLFFSLCVIRAFIVFVDTYVYGGVLMVKEGEQP